MKKLFIQIIIVTISLFLFSADSFVIAAPQANGLFTVSPSLNILTVSPGKTALQTITLTNGYANDITITSSFIGFHTTDAQGGVTFYNEESATNWFSLDPTTTTIPKLSFKEVHVAIAVPRDAGPEGHYVALLLREQNSQGGSNVHITAQISVLFFITVTGNTILNAQATGLAMQGYVFIMPFMHEPVYISKSITFVLSVTNTGNIHIVPSGVITVRTISGRIVEKLPLQTHIILPKTTRDYTLIWQTKNISPGNYRADASIVYADGGTLSSVAPFIVLSSNILIGIGIACIVVLITMTILLHKLINRKERNS